jgi:hypothetical protein
MDLTDRMTAHVLTFQANALVGRLKPLQPSQSLPA